MTNRLYANRQAHEFVPICDQPLVSESANWSVGQWGDYDNDGDMDVVVCASGYPSSAGPLAFYRNDGGFHFTRLTTNEIGPLAGELVNSFACAAGDYDNDGWLDLFVANGWGQSERRRCLLYRNNGDGTFTRITSGSPSNDLGAVLAVNWVDYNQDGNLDLFCTEHDDSILVCNRLYQNNGAGKSWLEAKCVGTTAPRWGTGAKVRVLASIRGRQLWQVRLIDAGGGAWGGQSFFAHFGLSDATTVLTLRVEWPSGTVQEVHNLPARQIVTITEPPTLQMTQAVAIRIRCWKGECLDLETSSDLRHWEPVTTLTNQTGSLWFTDLASGSGAVRFYRGRTR